MTGSSRQPRVRHDRPRVIDAAEFAADRARAVALTNVSRETWARLDRFVALLLEWQGRANLIGHSTESTLWTRHVADSLQLLALAPQAKTWVDLGSGGGFPGIAIACALADMPGACVHLVESSIKKATFLKEAVSVAAVPAVVHAVRIEDFVENCPNPLDVVTARALAPLAKLLSAAYPLLQRGACGLFPKGQYVDRELTEATRYWKIKAGLVPSRTDATGRIVHVTRIEPRGGVKRNRASSRNGESRPDE